MSFDRLKAGWLEKRRHLCENADAMRRAVMEKGKPIFERYGIQEAFLFGSVQRGKADFASDIDLLVNPLSGTAFWDFRHDLEEAIGYAPDIYTQDDDSVFVSKIRERGEQIYHV